MILKRVDLGIPLSDKAISGLGTRLAKIASRDKIHLGVDDTNAGQRLRDAEAGIHDSEED